MYTCSSSTPRVFVLSCFLVLVIVLQRGSHHVIGFILVFHHSLQSVIGGRGLSITFGEGQGQDRRGPRLLEARQRGAGLAAVQLLLAQCELRADLHRQETEREVSKVYNGQ